MMSLKNLNDQELLIQYSNGNTDAVSTLIERHKKRVFDYVRNMVKDEATADDISQETFIKVLHSLRGNKYIESGKFASWITRIAHNQVIDHFRRVKQLNNVSSDENSKVLNSKQLSDESIEDQLIHNQICADVRKLVEQLSVEQKEVVIMRYYLGMSFKEIAEKTGVSINTSLGRMRYALINLRKLIDENRLILN